MLLIQHHFFFYEKSQYESTYFHVHGFGGWQRIDFHIHEPQQVIVVDSAVFGLVQTCKNCNAL